MKSDSNNIRSSNHINLSVDYFARESGKSEETEEEGECLEQLKRLLIQLPVSNFNMLKYIRYCKFL